MDTNQKFWERMAKFYAPIQERSNKQLYLEVTEHALPYLFKEARVLEVASGSGQLTLPLHTHVQEYLATDYSGKMIAALKKRVHSSNLICSVEDATALPYQDCSFDVVLMANALHIMPEPEKALSEAYRVLKQGGILLAPTFVYEGKVNRFRMFLTEKIGFRTYRHFNLSELASFIESFSFEILEKELLSGDPLPEGFVCGKKQ